MRTPVALAIPGAVAAAKQFGLLLMPPPAVALTIPGAVIAAKQYSLLMPSPVALLAIPGAVEAAKQLAVGASAFLDLTTITSATFGLLLANLAWRRTPDWIKEDISFRSLRRNNEEVEVVPTEELSHLGSVVDKLQELAKSAKVNPVPQLHAAVLAFVQLSGQLKMKEKLREMGTGDDTLLTRDYTFRSRGVPTFPIEELQTEEFQQALSFATWAYYEDSEVLKSKLDGCNYSLLEHSHSSRPGNVAYFVAVDPEQKQILIGVKGTSNLEEILTVCCGRAVPLCDVDQEGNKSRVEGTAASPHSVQSIVDGSIVEVVSVHERIRVEDRDGDESNNYIRCHEGILISARRMVDKIQPLIEDLIRECGYSLVFCGHSLGASAATLAAIILRSRIPQLAKDTNGQRVRVYAFGPPPVLDHGSAVAAASFCTSIVNNADIIPRLSLANLMVFMEFLRNIHERLVEQGINPTGPQSTAAFLKKLSQGTGGDLLMTPEETHVAMRKAYSDVELRNPDHLYIPGRVILAFNPWLTEDKDDAAETGGSFLSKVSGGFSVSATRSKRMPYKCTVVDGTATALRNFEIDGARMFTDHATSSYYELLGMEYSY
jgi:hypothetical protein